LGKDTHTVLIRTRKGLLFWRQAIKKAHAGHQDGSSAFFCWQPDPENNLKNLVADQLETEDNEPHLLSFSFKNKARLFHAHNGLWRVLMYTEKLFLDIT
jgi:hypothetical protein